MTTQLPLNFRASPLPADFNGTAQEFLDALIERLSAESSNSISFFASGSVAPTSNVGPWLKNDQEWYVWDNGTAAYVPLVVNSESLKYIASQSAPDHTKYTFWIELDGSGKAQSVQYYSGGAWHDVYEDKFAQYSTTTAMNAAISAAVSAALGTKYPAKASDAAPQTIPIDGTPNQVLAATVDFDPDSCYNTGSSAYIVPATGYYQVFAELQVDNAGGDASTMEFALTVGINATPTNAQGVSTGLAIANPPGSRWYPQAGGIIQCTAGDAIRVYLTATTAGLAGNVNVSNLTFSVYRIQ